MDDQRSTETRNCHVGLIASVEQAINNERHKSDELVIQRCIKNIIIRNEYTYIFGDASEKRFSFFFFFFRIDRELLVRLFGSPNYEKYRAEA